MKLNWTRISGVILVLSWLTLRAFAQASEVTKEVAISVDQAPSIGDGDAQVTIVEFSDYQCPLSSRYFNLTMRELVKDYVSTGKVRYVFMDFPIESIHPLALKAAEGAHCAGEQGKFWELHDRLLRNQMAIGAEFLPLHAEMLKLDLPRFQECVESGKYAASIRASVIQGKKAGVKGTPGFFLGLTDPASSKLKAVTYVDGAQPYETFKEAIEKLLSRASD
jgi:protein-disulfide isomerase